MIKTINEIYTKNFMSKFFVDITVKEKSQIKLNKKKNSLNQYYLINMIRNTRKKLQRITDKKQTGKNSFERNDHKQDVIVQF